MVSFIEVFILAAIFGVLYAMLQLGSVKAWSQAAGGGRWRNSAPS